ncbi:MAG: N-acetyltransferase [Alphaproteobacteria bacterium]|nr:GNAT family N-acetyltransferase [Alphaproteobacteria bacterium]TAD89446.1 MAG: N-acetyltransferase [Alphaproteobacteria bacterium]
MTDPLSIRYADPEDAEQLVTLVNRLATESRFLVVDTIDPDTGPATVAEHLEAIQTSVLHVVLVAEVAERLVGIGLGAAEAHPAKRGSMRIDLGILSDWQRRGIGTQLMRGLEFAAKERGCHRLDLTVMVENIPAMRLYQACGFVFEGRLHRHLIINGEAVDQFLMAKMIG